MNINKKFDKTNGIETMQSSYPMVTNKKPDDNDTLVKQRLRINEKLFNYITTTENDEDFDDDNDRDSSLYQSQQSSSQNTSKNRYSFIEYEYLEESSDFNKRFNDYNNNVVDVPPLLLEDTSFNETDTIDEILLIADDGKVENLEIEYKRIKEEEKQAKRRMKHERKLKMNQKADKTKKHASVPLDDIYFRPERDDDAEHSSNDQNDINEKEDESPSLFK